MSQQPEKSVAQVLRDAADLLKRTGWIRGAYCSRDVAGHERFCMVGAINRAAANEDVAVAHRARGWIVSALRGGSAIHFNDQIAGRRSVVVAKLLEAADLAEGKATHV